MVPRNSFDKKKTIKLLFPILITEISNNDNIIMDDSKHIY